MTEIPESVYMHMHIYIFMYIFIIYVCIYLFTYSIYLCISVFMNLFTVCVYLLYLLTYIHACIQHAIYACKKYVCAFHVTCVDWAASKRCRSVADPMLCEAWQRASRWSREAGLVTSMSPLRFGGHWDLVRVHVRFQQAIAFHDVFQGFQGTKCGRVKEMPVVCPMLPCVEWPETF